MSGSNSNQPSQNQPPGTVELWPLKNPNYNGHEQEKILRKYLRLYFYAAFKWKDQVCSFHWIYCLVFLIQIVKVSLLTKQMFEFGHDRANFSSVVNRGHVTLCHLLLQNWDASWETLPYPPAHGVFAVYTIADWESEINFAVKRYYSAENDAIGYYKMLPGDKMEATVKYFDFSGFDDTQTSTKSSKELTNPTNNLVDSINSISSTTNGPRIVSTDSTYDSNNEHTHKTGWSFETTTGEATTLLGNNTDGISNGSESFTATTNESLQPTIGLSRLSDKLEIHDTTITLGSDAGFEGNENFSISKVFEYHNISQPFKRMLSVSLHFSMHSVRSHVENRLATCLRIEGWINFLDLDDNGQVTVDLVTKSIRIKCKQMNLELSDWHMGNSLKNVGGAVLVFCNISIVLTVLTLVFACFVCLKTKSFMKTYFKEYYGDGAEEEEDLPRSEYFRFLRPWDFVTLIADCLTVYATVWIVFETEETNWLLETVDANCTWLGIGCVMAWLSLLRFFKFHTKFHLLFKTLYRAFWDVLAYLVCISVMFVGFWICGYVVLGPYHVKFQTPSAAFETLFSMINADEIYATLANLEKTKSGGDWVTWFTRFYIGSYVAIFAVVVMNLLIALFMSAYETIKEQLKAKPEEKHLGLIEREIHKLLTDMFSESKSEGTTVHVLRSYIDETLMKSVINTRKPEEQTLIQSFGTIVKYSVDKNKDKDKNKNKLIFVRPRTLKSFMEDEKSENFNFSIGWCKCLFSRFSDD